MGCAGAVVLRQAVAGFQQNRVRGDECRRGADAGEEALGLGMILVPGIQQRENEPGVEEDAFSRHGS